MKLSPLTSGGIVVILTIVAAGLSLDRLWPGFFALPGTSGSSLSVSPEPTETPAPTPTPFVFQPDPKLQHLVDQHIATLKTAGVDPTQQSLWLESNQGTIGEYQGKTRFPAASLTKLATTLTALKSWPPDYRFFTRVSTTGTIVNGVLEGDLIIQGGGDPLYIWESGIQLGNQINQLGIQTVTGRLIIQGVFMMNFERDPMIAGNLLRQSLHADLWSGETYQQYQTLPAGTPEPKVTIQGEVVPMNTIPTGSQTLVEQSSLPLVNLLKQMNNYSNNLMAQLFADLLGGAPRLTETVVQAQVPPEEVTFSNGSGLGHENQISGRGTCQILKTIGEVLAPYNLGLSDVMPISQVDPGTLDYRNLPPGVTAKTGTLWDVSTLAGVISTSDRPATQLSPENPLCFAIFNRGENIDLFYTSQENLVTQLKSQL